MIKRQCWPISYGPILTSILIFAPFTPQSKGLQPGPTLCEERWIPGDGFPGLNGSAYAITDWDDGTGPAIYAAGGFTIAGDIFANSIAKWDGRSWSPLLGGVDGAIEAMLAYNGKLVVAGAFGFAGGMPTENIATWDGSQWHSLGTGTNDLINYLAVHRGDLIASGEFNIAGSVQVNGIARWDGSNWHALGSGNSGYPGPLAVLGDDLITTGRFHNANGEVVAGVVRWDGAEWCVLGPDVSFRFVDAFLVDGNELYAFGALRYMNGTEEFGLWRWDGTCWSRAADFVDANIFAMELFNGQLHVAGQIKLATYSPVARWDGARWHPVFIGFGHEYAYALHAFNETLYTGGDFRQIEDIPAFGIGSWDGKNWKALGQGFNLAPSDFLVYGRRLIAGGDFASTSGGPANHFASWDGNAWTAMSLDSELGVGYEDAPLVEFGGNLLTVVYLPPTPAGLHFQSLAQWDGSQWNPIGGTIRGYVRTMMVYHDDLIVAGHILEINGAPCSTHIVKWDGSTWSSLGVGVAGTYAPGVWALANYRGDLVVAGRFTSAGNATARNIALWNGEAWLPLSGLGVSNTIDHISSLTMHEGHLVAAGRFGAPSNSKNIARWNGAFWSGMGSGFNSYVQALVVYKGFLFAGADYSEPPNPQTVFLARWGGDGWYPLGLGIEQPVSALAVYNDELIVAAGQAAGGYVSAYWARWRAELCPTP